MVASTASLSQLSANRSRFFFKAQGFDTSAFRVKQFECHNHDLSDDYRFELVVSSLQSIDPKLLTHAEGSLTLIWDKAPVTVNGTISEASRIGRTLDAFEYEIVLTSPLNRLKLNRQSRVFLKKSVIEIVTELLTGADIPQSAFTFKTRHDYPRRAYVVQFEESDYAFLNQQLAHWGLFYYFKQLEDKTRLIIADHVAEMPQLAGTGALRYQLQTGETRDEETVYNFKARACLQTAEIKLKEYNYRTPADALETAHKSDNDVSGWGSDYRYGENYKTLEEGEWIAQVRLQTLDWQRQTFIAESDCCGLAPGHRFSLTHHPDPKLNGDYLVVKIEHHADQSAGDANTGDSEGSHYRNKLLLIRAGVPYRHPLDEALARPPMHTYFTGQVETTGGDYAHIDEQGRYRVRLPFDHSDTTKAEASHPVRMMQPYTGNKYGFHFPLHAGTEVTLACVNGDLDRPVIHGALPNTETPSPVTTNNPTQNILRTWGENELLMEDRKGEERIELFTRDRQNILTLDARDDQHLVRLASELGEMKVEAKRTLLLQSGDTHTVESGNDHVIFVENNQRMMTKNKDIQLEAATDIKFTAKQNVHVAAEAQDFSVDAEKDFVLRAGQNASFEIAEQNFDIQVVSGDFLLQAAKAITFKGQGGGVIHIGQGSGSIEIDTNGELNIAGPTVNIIGGTINIKGGNVANN
ncbi:MAG: type VI secretion system tip protein VgrG [Candidatus Thiodiazotropha sp. (ex Monitilora ramsayi)]|nr:type VI secretion system tip protein VgrG [Candidatus Thiodiazotropha sp. (ex Monitilora ramsayi)]